jgi:hypothetical protein
MRKLILLVLLIAGCVGIEHPGYRKLTSNRYSIRLEVEPSIDPNLPVSEWADQRADEWLAKKADWGLASRSDDELKRAIRSELVVVYPGNRLPDRPTFVGWNEYGSYIECSLCWPEGDVTLMYDPARERLFIGLYALPHEWKHTLLGDWHP